MSTNLSAHLTAIAVRRVELEEQASSAILTGRSALIRRFGHVLFHRCYTQPAPVVAQPSMAWFDGPRVQPRGLNGRFLSKAWLADAELFLPADRAWFRAPVRCTEGK